MTRFLSVFIALGTVAITGWIFWQHFSQPETLRSAAPDPVRIDARLVPPGALQAYQRAARQYNLDWRFLAALGYAESDHGRSPLAGVQNGINAAGCCAGPMQLCVTDDCGNVASMYARDGDQNGTYSVYDIDDAAATAGAYIRWMQQTVGRDPIKLAAAYNAGPTLVAREGIPPYPETRLYIKKVQLTMRQIERALS